MNARQFTFSILLKQKKNRAFSNLLLENALKNSEFTATDKAFATALFYGVIQKKICIDYQLSSVLRQPIKKLRDEVYIALQMGVYQLFFMDKVPASAAINESVKLVKRINALTLPVLLTPRCVISTVRDTACPRRMK